MGGRSGEGLWCVRWGYVGILDPHLLLPWSGGGCLLGVFHFNQARQALLQLADLGAGQGAVLVSCYVPLELI